MGPVTCEDEVGVGIDEAGRDEPPGRVHGRGGRRARHGPEDRLGGPHGHDAPAGRGDRAIGDDPRIGEGGSSPRHAPRRQRRQFGGMDHQEIGRRGHCHLAVARATLARISCSGTVSSVPCSTTGRPATTTQAMALGSRA